MFVVGDLKIKLRICLNFQFTFPCVEAGTQIVDVTGFTLLKSELGKAAARVLDQSVHTRGYQATGWPFRSHIANGSTSAIAYEEKRTRL